MGLREELVIEAGTETHLANLCRRALERINMQSVRISVLEQQIQRMRQDRQYIIGFNDGFEEAVKQSTR